MRCFLASLFAFAMLLQAPSLCAHAAGPAMQAAAADMADMAHMHGDNGMDHMSQSGCAPDCAGGPGCDSCAATAFADVAQSPALSGLKLPSIAASLSPYFSGQPAATDPPPPRTA